MLHIFYHFTTLCVVHQFNETNVQYKIICGFLEFYKFIFNQTIGFGEQK